MPKALRVALAVAAGLAVAFVLVVAVEFLSAVVHPLPPDFDGSEDAMCEHVKRYPQWVLAVASVLWAGIALVSSGLAKRIGNRGCGWAVGLLLLAATLFNVTMLPYPVWFKVISPALQGIVLLAVLRSPDGTSDRHV
jgi:hypothetical protein